MPMTQKPESRILSTQTENHPASLRNLRDFIHLLLPRDGLLVKFGKKSSGSCVISVLLWTFNWHDSECGVSFISVLSKLTREIWANEVFLKFHVSNRVLSTMLLAKSAVLWTRTHTHTHTHTLVYAFILSFSCGHPQPYLGHWRK